MVRMSRLGRYRMFTLGSQRTGHREGPPFTTGDTIGRFRWTARFGLVIT